MNALEVRACSLQLVTEHRDSGNLQKFLWALILQQCISPLTFSSLPPGEAYQGKTTLASQLELNHHFSPPRNFPQMICPHWVTVGPHFFLISLQFSGIGVRDGSMDKASMCRNAHCNPGEWKRTQAGLEGSWPTISATVSSRLREILYLKKVRWTSD